MSLTKEAQDLFYQLGLQMASTMKATPYEEAKRRWDLMKDTNSREEAKTSFYAGADAVDMDAKRRSTRIS